MTRHQIDLVQKSWRQVQPIGDTAAALFYQELFRLYGVKPQQYDTVGAALLWTLGRGLGDAFTPEVKAAWTETYSVLARTMKDAAAAP